MTIRVFSFAAVAVLSCTAVQAQITPASHAQCGSECCAEGCVNVCDGTAGCCPTGACGSGNGWCGNGCNCGCGNNGCPLGFTQCDHCPLGIGCDDSSCLTNSCLSHTCLGRHCCNKAYPDAGWAPPAFYPVNRDAAWYATWHPQTPYGAPGGGFVAQYPQVYQPTDTTQLGFTYQNVPTWQSRTDRIPPVPRPGAFHSRSCPCQPAGHCMTGGTYSVGHHHYAVQAPAVRPARSSRVASAAGTRRVVRPAAGSQQSGSFFNLSSLTELFD